MTSKEDKPTPEPQVVCTAATTARISANEDDKEADGDCTELNK